MAAAGGGSGGSDGGPISLLILNRKEIYLVMALTNGWVPLLTG